jgi:hypothetical protein
VVRDGVGVGGQDGVLLMMFSVLAWGGLFDVDAPARVAGSARTDRRGGQGGVCAWVDRRGCRFGDRGLARTAANAR